MKLTSGALFACLCIAALSSCNHAGNKTTTMADSVVLADTSMLTQPQAEAFEATIDGRQTHLYILKNKNIQAAFTNYGARIVSLFVPDRTNKLVNVNLGFDHVKGYQTSTEPYFGATIGRFGNRIARGEFSIDGKKYKVPVNNAPNALHGGPEGFQNKVWDASLSGDSSITFHYVSKDGEMGFPGNLDVRVTYSLHSNGELHASFEATTDKKTVVNLTNHAFFNLNGDGTILNHLVHINADRYTPVDSTLIPLGRHEAVEGTPFDFRKEKTIGQDIETDHVQLKNGKGYDHNYVLNDTEKYKGLKLAARVTGDKTGIRLSLYTKEPGMQFYSGNFMQSKNNLMGDKKDDLRTAFAIEPQHFPDSPNQPSFPSTVLEPGQTYKTQSVYKFDIVNL